MTGKSPFLDKMELLGARHGRQRWRRPDGKRLYEWDHTHRHIEAYDARGRHLGALDPNTGQFIAGPVKGRRIDV